MAEEERKVEIPTPFGPVTLPKLREALPAFPPEVPKMDERRSKAMSHAVAIDLSSIIGWVPAVGDAIADVVEDLHGAELRKLLTKEEMDRYVVEDKVAPSTIALARVFMKIPLKEER
ncbi:MAG: hypothetical protein ACE5Z5_09550 [Candidatus Bathyarchaeia archaeon]